MSAEPTALAAAPREMLARVRFLLSDLDDTLSERGRVGSSVIAALERLQAAGIKTIVVTGRPAGWADAIARLWPIAGVVGENGALSYWRDAAGALERRYYFDARKLDELMRTAEETLKFEKGLKLALDQPYRVADVAVDFREDVGPFPIALAERIRDHFRAAGFQATVSSIHVNAWAGGYSKASTATDLLAKAFAVSDFAGETLYVGDSPNDEPMFEAFPLSAAVANVREFLPGMNKRPRWIMRAERGAGIVELAEALIAARSA
ncbi:MAG: HAD family hydrolase [Hyphomonadaceae bacterium]